MKCRTLIEFAFDFDLAAVFLNNSMHNRQPEARSVIFGCKKRIEHVWDVLWFDSLTTVANADSQNLVRLTICLSQGGNDFFVAPNLGADVQCASIFHRVHGIQE